jgi:hypothetical protein
MQVELRADAEPVLLDSLVTAAAARGYVLVARDADRERIRLERPATLGEVGALGWQFEDTERKRLEFELVAVKRHPEEVAIVGTITLVQNPGTVPEKEEDMGRQEPYRRELRAILQGARAAVGP